MAGLVERIISAAGDFVLNEYFNVMQPDLAEKVRQLLCDIVVPVIGRAPIQEGTVELTESIRRFRFPRVSGMTVIQGNKQACILPGYLNGSKYVGDFTLYFSAITPIHSRTTSSSKLFGRCTKRNSSTFGDRCSTQPRTVASASGSIRIPRITPSIIAGGT